jgi:hypothetical protein
VVRTRPRPLSDVEHAGRADRVADQMTSWPAPGTGDDGYRLRVSLT